MSFLRSGLAGIVLAVPAIWLMSTTRGSPGTAMTGRLRTGVVDGLASGLGFSLLFVALERAGDGSGLWPVAAGQTSATVVVGPVASAARMRWGALRGQSGRQAVGAGVLGIVATILYFRAAHASLLTVAAVLTSVYPGVTVGLAAILLHEGPTRIQWSGLGLGAIAVTAIVLG